MALKTPRDLLNVVFKVFSKKLPMIVETPAPSGNPKVSREDGGAETTPPGMC